MSKQTTPINTQCQKRLHGREHGRCANDATTGIFQWESGDTDVNLDRPLFVVCGEHKREWDFRKGHYFRNVPLRRG